LRSDNGRIGTRGHLGPGPGHEGGTRVIGMATDAPGDFAERPPTGSAVLVRTCRAVTRNWLVVESVDAEGDLGGFHQDGADLWLVAAG
jgi:hypothetical protein